MNKKILLGMLVLILAFGFMVASCSDDGGVPSAVKNLPSFDGRAVNSQAEAEQLGDESMGVIMMAIDDAISNSPSIIRDPLQSEESRNVIFDDNFNHNGVRGHERLTVTGSNPITANYSLLATLDGTYTGYRIVGRIESTANFTVSGSEHNPNISGRMNYTATYTVSANGVGMKLHATVNANITSSNYGTMTMRATAYDNDNNVLYTFNMSQSGRIEDWDF